jgi:hypothetical protein
VAFLRYSRVTHGDHRVEERAQRTFLGGLYSGEHTTEQAQEERGWSLEMDEEVVARDGIEPPTRGLSMAASIPLSKLRRSAAGALRWMKRWWPETGSNRRRRPFQGRALPLSYLALAWSA